MPWLRSNRGSGYNPAMFRFLLIFLIFFTHSAYATDSYSDKIITDSQAKIFEDTKKGAKQGDTVAQYNLGASYDKGEGVTEDDAEAVRWYRKAAEQGHAKAQFNLGVMYVHERRRRDIPRGLCRGRGLVQGCRAGTCRGTDQSCLAPEDEYCQGCTEVQSMKRLKMKNKRSHILRRCYDEAVAWFRLLRRGLWPQNRDMPRHSSILALCIQKAKEFPRTTCKLMLGSVLPLHKAMKRQKKQKKSSPML